MALSYFTVSLRALRRQLDLWLTHLPDVTPFYAVKCNDDAIMMRYMRDYYPELGFDCASIREIETALPISGARDIIYAQPCKKIEDIKIASVRGVLSTVVDSVEEVEKLREARWDGEVLVRLLVDDRGSKQPFGKKFGAPAAWLPRIYDAARAGRLNMTGYSFHVGSICGDPAQYSAAIANCARAASLAAQYGYGTTKVDIGGGFVPNNRDFAAIAKHVRSAASTHFPDRAVKFIAEPGRFLAAPTHTLYTTVIGKKPVYPEPSRATEAAWRITVDESVYGSFSNIPFDGQKPVLERVRPAIRNEKRRPTIVFGRTCDSGDLIDAAARMYEVQVGDILRVRNMGAYTTVTASEFNGFPKAHKIYDQLR